MKCQNFLFKGIPNRFTYTFIFSLLFFATNQVDAQVGINTTTPDASAMLDIDSTDKGMLIPRVNLTNINVTMLDGVNTAATGLLIYNTNAATVGGDGVGFYSFNSSIWEKILTSASAGVMDADFFEEGTTTPPDDITDDIFTQGNVAIGKNTADYKLDIEETSGTLATNTLINSNSASTVFGHRVTNTSPNASIATASANVVSGNAGIKRAIWNDIVSGSGTHYGIFNNIGGTGSGDRYGSYNSAAGFGNGTHYGSYNRAAGPDDGQRFASYQDISSDGNGLHVGSRNSISGDGTGLHYGSYNIVSGSGSGNKYGSYNQVTGGTGDKYGIYALISDFSGGMHYGLYSDVTKVGSYAGYFLGSVSVGTTTGNNYILPVSRGTVDQVMQTDGAGNVSWSDPSGLGLEDHDFYEEGTTTSPDNISDDMFTFGNVAIGKNTADYGLDVNTTSQTRTISLNNSANSGIISGIFNNVSGNGGTSQRGVYNLLGGTGNSLKYGVYNNITGGGSVNHYATYNTLSGSGTGQQYGSYQILSNTGDATHAGCRNQLTGNGDGQQFGSHNLLSGDGNGEHFGVNSSLSGEGSGNKYGVRSTILTSAGGTHYGVYSTATKPGSYAGYFLGTIAVGTAIANTYSFPAARGTANQIMQTDGAGNVSWADSSILLSASNGLNISGGDVILGGALTQATTITQGTNNFTLDLTGTGDFQIDGNTTPDILFADGGNNLVRFGSQTGNLFNNGAVVSGITIDYVADFDNSGAGTTIGVGSAEYIADAGPNRIMLYGSFFPAIDDNFDIGSATQRWDDVYATSGLVNTSDVRLKKNVKTLSYGLTEILRITPISYQWKGKNNSETKLGFSAQELLQILPEVVKTHDVEISEKDGSIQSKPNDVLGVYYSDIIPVTVKAIQEQQSEIEQLKTENEMLKEKLNVQEARLQKIEAVLNKTN